MTCSNQGWMYFKHKSISTNVQGNVSISSFAATISIIVRGHQVEVLNSGVFWFNF